MNQNKIESMRAKYDEAIIEQVNNWNLDWNHIWMHYNKDQINQIVTQQVSHVLDRIGATKNGLEHAINIDRKLQEKYGWDNSPETNLKRLAEKKQIVEDEIKFWQDVQKERS